MDRYETEMAERIPAPTGTFLLSDGGFLTDLNCRYIMADATSLTFDPNTPFDVWMNLTERLLATERRIHWYIADAINFGQNNRDYGERYSQVLQATDRWSYGTLANISATGRAIERSRRREDVDFSTHTAVAPLPPKMQETMLDFAVEKGWSLRETRDAVKVAQREIKRAEQAALPVPQLVIPSCDVVVADARALPLADETVDLIVTSPPYALDKEYGGLGDIRVDEWRAFMGDVCRELYRVAQPGARLALNIPLDTTRPYHRPTYAQALFAAQRAGWSYRYTGVWHDDQLGKSTARGSVDSSSAPAMIAPVEMILLLYKGDAWGRGMPEGCPSDLTHADWIEWTNFFWQFPGESNPWEGFPAAYPLELPRRLIHLLSFPGELVLDPFVGSGTTALAAVRAGRRFFGVDREETYVRSTLRRVEKGVVA